MFRKKDIVSRLRARFGADTPIAGPVGMAFTPAMEPEWQELEEQVDAALKQVGSAVVASWEVGAAEIARVIIGLPDERALIERYSDALVPTLSAFQDLHKGCPGAFAEGLRAGRADGTLTSATRPLVMLFSGLDQRAQDGWAKTTEYLEPLFERCRAGTPVRAAFAAAPLAEACRKGESTLRSTLSTLPRAASLDDGVVEAFEAARDAMVRDLEFALHTPTRALAAGLR